MVCGSTGGVVWRCTVDGCSDGGHYLCEQCTHGGCPLCGSNDLVSEIE